MRVTFRFETCMVLAELTVEETAVSLSYAGRPWEF